MSIAPIPEVDDESAATRLLAITVVRAGKAGIRRVESEALRPLGLSNSGYSLLILLRTEGPSQPRELAKLMEVAVPSITSLVNTLERRGLVARRRSTVDGRLVTVSITDAGEQLATKAQVQTKRVVDMAASGLSVEERGLLQEYLERYLAGIGESWSSPADVIGEPRESKIRRMTASDGETPQPGGD